MKKKTEKVGRVIVLKGALTQKHELDVAAILALSGKDVTFIPVRNIPTADILYEGREWEIKSPLGKSSKTIENNLRKALRQSRNIIIDLRRVGIREDKCIREISRQVKNMKGMRRIKIVTKDSRVIDII